MFDSIAAFRRAVLALALSDSPALLSDLQRLVERSASSLIDKRRAPEQDFAYVQIELAGILRRWPTCRGRAGEDNLLRELAEGCGFDFGGEGAEDARIACRQSIVRLRGVSKEVISLTYVRKADAVLCSKDDSRQILDERDARKYGKDKCSKQD